MTVVVGCGRGEGSGGGGLGVKKQTKKQTNKKNGNLAFYAQSTNLVISGRKKREVKKKKKADTHTLYSVCSIRKT